MKSIQTIFLLLLFTALGTSARAQQFRALLITETAGWHHPSIVDGVQALKQMATRHEFALDRQQDAMPINDDVLKNYQVVIFLSTTGDIFNDDEQAAFERYIQGGGGYVGIHAASDTEYEWEWYTKLVGHMFYIHPSVQSAMLRTETRDFPGMEQWPDRLLFTDEWYEFLPGGGEGLNYLITIDEKSYDFMANWGPDKVAKGMGERHPISWYHDYDGGRAFYTAMGHNPGAYEEDLFLKHLYGGIYWSATGRGIPTKK